MERRVVAVVGELHRDLTYETTVFTDLANEVARRLVESRGEQSEEKLRELVLGTLRDSPKKLPAGALVTRGGNGNNSATLLAKLGVPVKLATVVGSDAAAWMRSELKAERIDDSLVVEKPRPTPTSTILRDPNVTKILVAPNLKAEMNFEGVQLDLRSFDDVAVAFFTPMGEKYAKLYRDLSSVDGGPVVAFTLETQQVPDLGGLGACLSSPADIMFANVDDAASVAGVEVPRNGPLDALARLDDNFANFAGVRVYTWGRRGSVAFVRDAASPVVTPVVEVRVKDRTGAGDSFAAGFLAHFAGALGGRDRAAFRLLEGYQLRRIVVKACELGSLAAAYRVATARAPTADDLRRFAEERGLGLQTPSRSLSP